LVTDSVLEQVPALVPRTGNTDGTKQAGDIRARWAWVEPSVWTTRMLTALESGVKGGVWFSLMDKVYAPGNLHSAFERVHQNRGSAGVDHQTVGQYVHGLEERLDHLHEALRDGRYHPQAIRRTWIPKPGSTEKRPLGIPTVQDRVAQTALRHVLEPIFEREFAEHSYGFRPGRGCKDALRRVDALLKAGYTWVVDADIKGYFDSIPHEPLMERVRRRIADSRVLALVQAYLEQDVLDSMEQWTPDEGCPQGAVISPLLSNIYLDPLDHLMAKAGYEMVRYADDFVLLCHSEAQAHQALELVKRWMDEAQLTLHPTKTRVVDATQRGGFDFLGYHFERGYKRPRKKSLAKLKETIRGKTQRTNGCSFTTIVADVNRTLRGWFEYFKHSSKGELRALDPWIRMRLRSVLRKRLKRKGRAHGWLDHQRWPNAYFAEHGLYSLNAAHVSARQSPCG